MSVIRVLARTTVRWRMTRMPTRLFSRMLSISARVWARAVRAWWLSVMSRITARSAATPPSASRIGDTERSTQMAEPSLRR